MRPRGFQTVGVGIDLVVVYLAVGVAGFQAGK